MIQLILHLRIAEKTSKMSFKNSDIKKTHHNFEMMKMDSQLIEKSSLKPSPWFEAPEDVEKHLFTAEMITKLRSYDRTE